MNRRLFLLPCIVLILPFFSCVKKQSPPLELPSTPMLTSKYLWGVANRPYLRILESPDSTAPPKGVLRHGDIVRIVSKVASEDNSSYWFEIQVPESGLNGWTLDENIDIYDSPAQARTARANILVSE